MNRLLLISAGRHTPTLRIKYAAPSSSAVRLLTARHFSDSTVADDADSEIKTGTVKHYIYKSGYGYIIPDGVDKHKHEKSDILFVHGSAIKTIELAGVTFSPGLGRGERVQFKVGPSQLGQESRRALDVHLEGGGVVPPFRPDYLEGFIRRERAKLGDEVYDIFSTSENQTELETNIVAAYDKAKRNIERQTAKVEKAMKKVGQMNEEQNGGEEQKKGEEENGGEEQKEREEEKDGEEKKDAEEEKDVEEKKE